MGIVTTSFRHEGDIYGTCLFYVANPGKVEIFIPDPHTGKGDDYVFLEKASSKNVIHDPKM